MKATLATIKDGDEIVLPSGDRPDPSPIPSCTEKWLQKKIS